MIFALALHTLPVSGYSNRVMRKNLLARRLLLVPFFVLYAHLFFIQATIPVIYLYRFINPPVTSVMLYRKAVFHWKIRKVRYLPLKRVPKRTRNMIIKGEDGSLFVHHGVVPAALKNAWQINKRVGRPLYGGSTITMQTARTLFLVPEKSYLRKYAEMILAVEMEHILGKNRIFELYLNYAEWGKGVFGVEAASVYHYKRSVTKLSTDESARLVTLLSSPIKYSPYTIQKSGILRSRYNYLISRFAPPPIPQDGTVAP